MFHQSATTPALITRLEDLQQLVSALAREPILAVDTESNSLYAYREQVCLIQFSTPQDDFLVDPLSLPDLSPLAPLFANPAIEKVFHAAEYDILCLKRDFSFQFVNIFDTMTAARILGRKEVGLGSLLEAEFGVLLDKHYQRANWGQRPLTDEMLDYARGDTHSLIPLRNRLRAELEESQRWTIAAEDFVRLASINGRSPENDPASCWQIGGVSELTPQQTAVLQELCRYRDHAARAANRPLFKVIGPKTLLEIARHCPGSMHELAYIPGMSQGQLRRHGRSLLQAVNRGLEAEPLYPSRIPRPDERYVARLEALRQWRKKTAALLSVESDVVLPRELMYEIAARNPQDEAGLSAIMSAAPQRFEQFGDQILQALLPRQA